MPVRIEGVAIICDGQTCKLSKRPFIAFAHVDIRKGSLSIVPPRGWTRDDEDYWFCPLCSENRVLEKTLQAEVPNSDEDPPILKISREERLREMKEIVRADLEEREAEFPELREYIRSLIEENSPDFVGYVGVGTKYRTEVRVRGKYVDISWPGSQTLSLVLQHKDLKLVSPPSFIDRSILEWVQNCLLTIDPNEISNNAETMSQ